MKKQKIGAWIMMVSLCLFGLTAAAQASDEPDGAAEETEITGEVVLVLSEEEMEALWAQTDLTEEAPAADGAASGTYLVEDARSMLAMINEFRTGSDASKTVFNQPGKTYLKELAYDYNLEQIAMERAKELVDSFSHTRPNGQYYSGFTYNGTTTSGENIAELSIYSQYATVRGTFTYLQEINDSYSGQGHRRNMLNPNYTSVGIACYYYDGWYYWAQEFGKTTPTYSASTIPGDVNGDNTVSLKDVTVLFQYVNKQISTMPNGAVADVNNDDQITLKDVTRLFQYVNKQIDYM
jgi:uncharacterized protein YkwD